MTTNTIEIKSDINNDLDWHKLRYVVCQRQIILFSFFSTVYECLARHKAPNGRSNIPFTMVRTTMEPHNVQYNNNLCVSCIIRNENETTRKNSIRFNISDNFDAIRPIFARSISFRYFSFSNDLSVKLLTLPKKQIMFAL